MLPHEKRRFLRNTCVEEMMFENHIAREIVVVLDFDGCIAIGEHVKIKYARMYHKIDIGPKTCMSETYPLGSVMYKQLMKKVMVENTDEYTLDPHCKEVLNALVQEHFVFIIVSSRDEKALESCRTFVKKQQLPIRACYGTDDKSKDNICRKVKARALFDDGLKKLLELQDSPLQLYFLEREWNTHEKVSKEVQKRIIPLSDWRAFGLEMRKMKQQHEAICFYKQWINSDTHISDIHEVIQKDPLFATQCLREYSRE